MAKYKNIQLNGTEYALTGLAGTNACVKNNSSDVIYVSPRAGIAAGSDDVVPVQAGESAVILDCCGSLYLLGTGGAVVVSSDYTNNFFDTPPSQGGTAPVRRGNENLLINPDFRINQRGVRGTITQSGYFVDRWKLISGSVTISGSGVMTLNGTIAQTLETPAAGETAVSASAGTASYDADAATFYLTANGEEILWAKLENGSSVTPFDEPDNATELTKCQRFFVALPYGEYNGCGNVITSSTVCLGIPLSTTLRAVPKLLNTNEMQFKICTINGTITGTVSSVSVCSMGVQLILDCSTSGSINGTPVTGSHYPQESGRAPIYLNAEL